MEILIPLILIGAGIYIYLELRKKPLSQENLPYAKKKYLLTEAELKFFHVLQQAVGDQYYICPQIHLPSIVFTSAKGRQFYSAFSRIKQKSVDFVICDKQYLSPLCVIELNDSSHSRSRRQQRDTFVTQILEHIQLPLISIPVSYNYDVDEIKSLLRDRINRHSDKT